jgi:hypothetical protein
MNTAINTTTIREFQGGICEIEKLPDEPGRNWVKVRFDAQGGRRVLNTKKTGGKK